MLNTITPQEAKRLVDQGAQLIDIRGADEHARERIPGAQNRPLDRLAGLDTRGSIAVFHCRSGNRTQVNAAQLADAAQCEAYIVEGGIEAWKKAGLPIVSDKSQPLEIMRQVQIAAGGLVVSGAGLGFLVHPAFHGLSAFVGAGLIFAGATGWCGMAMLLAQMPWNRRALAPGACPGKVDTGFPSGHAQKQKSESGMAIRRKVIPL